MRKMILLIAIFLCLTSAGIVSAESIDLGFWCIAFDDNLPTSEGHLTETYDYFWRSEIYNYGINYIYDWWLIPSYSYSVLNVTESPDGSIYADSPSNRRNRGREIGDREIGDSALFLLEKGGIGVKKGIEGKIRGGK